MSGCDWCTAWLDGAGDAAQRADFEAHLAQCQRCQAEVGQWQAVGVSLRAAHPEDHDAPSGALTTRLLTRAAEDPRASSSALARWWPAGAAVALVTVMVTVMVARTTAERPEVLSLVMTHGEYAALDGGLVETGPGGRALLALGLDTVGLGAQSRVRVERADRHATSLRLERGTLALAVERGLGPRSFDVITPMAAVHVTGTVFRVAIAPHQLRAEVLRGEIEVRPAGREAFRVSAGGALLVSETSITRVPLDTSVFSELEASPVAGPLVDAGTPAEVGSTPTSAPPRGVSKMKKNEWRTRAARGDCAAVSTEVERALAADGSDADLWLLIGDCHRTAARPAQAVEAYLRAASVKWHPQNLGHLFAASILQDDLAQPARALGALERYLAAGAETPALEAAARVRRARVQRELGKEREARAGFQFIIEHFPDTPAAAEALQLCRICAG